MNEIVIIIGYDDRSSQMMERFFINNGMKSAKISSQNSVSPKEIDDVLNKMVNSKKKGKINSIWNNLALNLFLANLESPFWGWSDSNALNLVEYWYKLDSNIKFVFTYNRPEDIFFYKEPERIKNIDERWVKKEFDIWIRYSKRVLELVNKFPRNCILVNEKQFLTSPDDSIKKIFNKLNVSVLPIKNGKSPNKLINIIPENNIFNLIIERILISNKQIGILYSKLQHLSCLPYKYDNSNYGSISSYIHAWNDMLEYFYNGKLEDKLNKKIVEQERDKEKLLNKYNVVLEDNQALLKQLFLVQERFEEVFLENRKLKSKFSPILLGADERIRKQLRYRLGFQMINSSRSIFGILLMPFSLIRVYIRYKVDKIKNKEKLPLISSYQDYYKAERMRNHLSYKLGGVFLDNFKLPFKWIFLPREIIKVVREFRQRKM